MIIQFTKKQIEFKEGKIFYWEGGISSPSPPVVFLPGWSVSVAPYGDSLTMLAQRYQVIALDLPGFGESISFIPLQNYQDYAYCIIAFLNQLNIQKVHLIGHSMGGAIAITIAVLMPSLVSSLILVDSTGIPLGFLPKILLRRSIELPAQIGSFKLKPLSKMLQSFFYNCLFKPQNVIQAAWIALEEDISVVLSQVKSPTLILWGENDYFTPLELGQKLAQEIKSSQLIVVKGKYHEWMMFYSEKFVSVVFDFIN